MVCRDYLWTGDKDYLETMWPARGQGHGLHRFAGFQRRRPARPEHRRCRPTTSGECAARPPTSPRSGSARCGPPCAWRATWARPTTPSAGQATLDKASASFDRLLFNGEYYSLWVDGALRDEICMSDQISGEWFSHLMGLPTTISEEEPGRAVDSILKYNYSPGVGLHNATAPKGGTGLPAMNNHQAGGVWSGIEFAFASFLMDHGRYADGARLCEAVHRRYLRAGMPWNHVECGGHYTRAMSSWATLLAATGFKPDLPKKAVAILPTVPGDFHAPWVTASGFGTITRTGRRWPLASPMSPCPSRRSASICPIPRPGSAHALTPPCPRTA